VIPEGVVERMTNLTSLILDECFGVELGALWQLQELTLGFQRKQPIVISDAATLTFLCTNIGRTTVLTVWPPCPGK